MNEQIELAEHARWLPIPLGVDPEEARQQVAAAFAGTEDADTQAAAIAGVVARMATPPDESTHNLAAWALVRSPNELDVTGFAALRVVHIDPRTTEEDAMAELTAGMELMAESLSRRIETRSGEALSIRVRPTVRTGEGRVEVHQLNAVLWCRPQHEALFVLSHYETDLAQAVPAADLLDELAVGFAGMQE